jgi:hypothetical protein
MIMEVFTVVSCQVEDRWKLGGEDRKDVVRRGEQTDVVGWLVFHGNTSIDIVDNSICVLVQAIGGPVKLDPERRHGCGKKGCIRDIVRTVRV